MARKSTPRTARAPHAAADFRRRLLRWFRRCGRDLPWRRTRDPYHVLVSEFMLQQTQVARVQEYYPRFLARYPTVDALADAPAAMVRETWEGLGYYRRAANLHRLAQEVVRDHAGVIPADPALLLSYRASDATRQGRWRASPSSAPRRRWTRTWRGCCAGPFIPRLRGSGAQPRLWETAAAIIPRRGKSAWVFNQAIMELGALVCTARVARCGNCPVRSACATGRGA